MSRFAVRRLVARRARRAALALLPALGAACGGADHVTAPGTPAPSPGAVETTYAAPQARTYRMGFSAIPPRLDGAQSLLATVTAWHPHADAAILQNDVPWDALLNGATAASEVARDIVPLVDYYRSLGLSPVVVTIEPLNSGARDKQPWPLLARSRSVSEATVQTLYRRYAVEVARAAKPDYLVLALETNLVRAVAPAAVSTALATMVNGAAADIRKAGLTTRLGVSIEVETAWGLLPRTVMQAAPVFTGVATERAKFPFLQFLGLSAYPHIGGFTNPAQVPADYYARLAGSPALPVLVTEGGWASNSGAFWTSTPAIQAAWITRQAALLDSVKAVAVFQLNFTDLDLAAWSPGPGVDLSAHVRLGMVDTGLKPKPSLTAWDQVFARPRR